jgi:pyruvate-formate lyase
MVLAAIAKIGVVAYINYYIDYSNFLSESMRHGVHAKVIRNPGECKMNTSKYIKWAMEQCGHWGNNYFPRGDLEREYYAACRRDQAYVLRRLGVDATACRARAGLFCEQLSNAEAVVLEDFDLCGRLTLDGRFCRRAAPSDSIGEDEVRSAMDLHPLRLFSSRWDHASAETERFLAIGIEGERERIRVQLALERPVEERDFLESMLETLDAFSEFIQAHIEPALAMGKVELAESLKVVANEPPQTFYQAILLLHLRFVAWAFEGRGAIALGRMDIHLGKFYQADLDAGILDRERALDYIEQFIVLLSVGYLNPVNSLTIGGRLPDGNEGTNAVSYLIMEAFGRCKLPGVNLFARVHRDSPVEFLDACARLVFTGGGMPAICNEQVGIDQLALYGVTREDALRQTYTGCAHLFVEGLQVPWTEGRWLTPVPLILQAMEAFRDRPDATFEEFLADLRDRMFANARQAVDAYNDQIRRCNGKNSPDVFYSVFIDDSIERGRELSIGGARYPGVFGLDIYGLGLAVDMLSAIKVFVFEGDLGMCELIEACKSDFADCEPLRQQLLRRAPKYGNDDDAVDDLAVWMVGVADEACKTLEPMMEDGSKLKLIFPGTLGYINMGLNTPATPDGRHAREPYSDSGSPVAGRDKKGLTALLNSLAKIDHSGFHGLALNIRLNHRDFSGETGCRRFRAILDFMFDSSIQELQFNCVSTELLRAAQKNPGEYSNLAIRVAGYSALFTMLNKNEQDAIIARQEH